MMYVVKLYAVKLLCCHVWRKCLFRIIDCGQNSVGLKMYHHNMVMARVSSLIWPISISEKYIKILFELCK